MPMMKRIFSLLCAVLMTACALPASALDIEAYSPLITPMESLREEDGTLSVDEFLPAGTPVFYLRDMTEEESAALGLEYYPGEYTLASYISPSTGEAAEAWFYALPYEVSADLGDGLPRMDVSIGRADDTVDTYSVAWKDGSIQAGGEAPLGEEDYEFAAWLIAEVAQYTEANYGIDPAMLLNGCTEIRKENGGDSWMLCIYVCPQFFDLYTFDMDGNLLTTNLSSGGVG